MMSLLGLFQLETPRRSGEAFSPVPQPSRWQLECVVRQHRTLHNATKARGEGSEDRRAAWGLKRRAA